MTGDEMFATMELARGGLSLFGALALFMGAFIIFNTFRTVVAERRRDIGLLRALGATRRTVIGIILTEGMLQGLIGSGIGLFLGYLMAVGVLKVAQGPMSQFINVTWGMPVVSPGLILVSMLLGVGVTVLAGLLPAWNASHITPLEALRPTQAEVEFKRQTGTSFIVGMIILVLTVAAILSGQTALILPGGIFFLVGLVLVAPALVRPFAILFGRLVEFATIRQGIGNLAQSNLTRQPSRVAVTASASMLGLAVIVAAGGLVASMSGMIFDMLHDSLGSDYLFIPPSVCGETMWAPIPLLLRTCARWKAWTWSTPCDSRPLRRMGRRYPCWESIRWSTLRSADYISRRATNLPTRSCLQVVP
jgi:putative ABC transport system permease protein